jgi:hypothetical protein
MIWEDVLPAAARRLRPVAARNGRHRAEASIAAPIAFSSEDTMPHHEKHSTIAAAGEITHVFAHRFVFRTGSKAVLADLTPHGLEIIELRVGDKIAIEGEQKRSEIKVFKVERNGETFEIGDGPHSKQKHGPANPALAINAATNAGYEVIGAPRRKPKHFEVLGKKEGLFAELHVELDGDIRKAKPLFPEDHKWRSELEGQRESRSAEPAQRA